MMQASTTLGAPAAAAAPALIEYLPQTLPNLSISPFNSSGRAPQFVATAGQAYLRINETGVRLLELLDGTRSPESIQREFARRHTQRVPVEKISAFLNQCARSGLLRADTWPGATPTVAKPQGRVRHYRQLVAADRGMDWLARHRRIWFNPLTMLVMAGLIGFGLLWLFIAPHDVHLASLLYQIDIHGGNNRILALVPVLFLLGVALHEVAHNLACRMAGAPAGGFGVGLWANVMPVFVTDTRAAYTVDSKYRRAAISLAGPLVDFTILGIVSAGLALTAAGSDVQRLLLSYHGILLGLLLINLNPFLIRMDGYWVLTDLLEQPNLRRMTVRLMAVSVLRLLRRPVPASLSNGIEQRSRRWQLIALVYGLVAVSWTISFAISAALSLIHGMQIVWMLL